MKKMNKKGFTLVEIMIVVAIIGLLAAIGIPSIIGAYTQAQEKSKARNVTDVEKAKGMMTLPTEAGGWNFTSTNTQADVVAKLPGMLNIADTTALTVNQKVMYIGGIGTRASYAP